MGYFSNGSEGAIYEETFCKRCVHFGPEEGPGCVIWMAHLLHNYDECNKDDSILHLLIPRKGIENGKCNLFLPSPSTHERNE
jgi:hypothetical protein